MKWIVKDKPKQADPKPFEEVIKEALEETGIDPASWTDEELADWKSISNDWRIRQAARMEYNRRQGPQPIEEGLWTR